MALCTGAAHQGYVLREAVAEVGSRAVVCGHATAPDKGTTLLPMVKVEAEAMVVLCDDAELEQDVFPERKLRTGGET